MPKVGAPVTTFTPERKKELIELLQKYINETKVPIVAEFAYLNNVLRASLYGVPELQTLLKRLIEKKEAALEKLSLAGSVNTTQAIFSLKQLGWRDRQEIEHSGGMDLIVTKRIVSEKPTDKDNEAADG